MRVIFLSFACALSLLTAPISAQAIADRYDLNISRQPLEGALRDFAHQTGLQIARFSDAVDGSEIVGPVSGKFTVDAALAALLTPHGLGYKVVNERTLAIVKLESGANAQGAGAGAGAAQDGGRRHSAFRLAQADEQADARSRQEAEALQDQASRTEDRASSGQSVSMKGIPEILVRATRTLNMDVRRTRDDVQPYTIFDREQLRQSPALNVDQFLKQRLTMNTIGATTAQTLTSSGARSQINLRGLGVSQTLILIDGHRVVGQFAGSVQQPDLNAIPLAAIERIEVLPTTASGIYGGSATGGVVNVVLRRDYEGVEAKLAYDNTFESDAGNRRADLSVGFDFADGRTTVLLAGSYQDQNPLLVHERDFVEEGRLEILRNNPTFFLNAAAPTLGATTNIRSADGSNLTLTGGPALSSPIAFIPAGYSGIASDNGAALAATAGAYNFDLPGSVQSPFGGQAGIMHTARSATGLGSIHHEFTPGFEAFLDLSTSEHKSTMAFNTITGTFSLPAGAPGNPFTQGVVVTTPIPEADGAARPRNEDRRIVAGVIFDLPKEWTGEADYTWNEAKQSTSFVANLQPAATAAVTSGTIDVFRDGVTGFGAFLNPDTRSSFQAELRDATVRASGPVARLPGGPLIISALLERRWEEFEGGSQVSATSTLFVPGRSQDVESVYLGTTIPVVSSQNARTGMRMLELQVAGRWDSYTTHGTSSFLTSPTATPATATNEVSSTDVTLGVRYQPFEWAMFRASYGTGFLPPSVSQLIASPPQTSTSPGFIDPLRGNTSVPAGLTVIAGGNPDLQPESSESWSAGLVFDLRMPLPWRASIDYTRIRKTDNISALSTQQTIDSEALLPSRIVRGANLPGDLPGWAGPITFIDQTAVNLSEADVEAYDVQLDTSVPFFGLGEIDLAALATWQTHYTTRLLPNADSVENVGITSANPLELKANVSATWRHQGWRVGLLGSYYDSYLVANPALPTSAITIANQGGTRIPSQTYFDLSAGYDFDESGSSSGLLSGVEIQAGVRNVFDEQPPFDASALAGLFRGAYSPYGDPRLMSYYVSIRKSL